MTGQMKKGVLELCILHLVSRQDLYGYEIMKQITAVFTDTQESTVYAILRRLLGDGHLTCHSRSESNGPPRKYYQTTPAGEAYLQESLELWNATVEGVGRLVATPPPGC